MKTLILYEQCDLGLHCLSVRKLSKVIVSSVGDANLASI